MSIEKLQNSIGGIDLYLLDQILKNRYQQKEAILDAGCGTGRNLKWFYNNAFQIFGVDANANSIEATKDAYPKFFNHFSVQNLDILNFDENAFDHIICNAVLHFAQNTQHFMNMFSELIRVVKPSGTIFIRMTNLEGIEKRVTLIADGVYRLPDKTNRFLLTDSLLQTMISVFNLKLLEPKKYVNVNNERCMSTIILTKRI